MDQSMHKGTKIPESLAWQHFHKIVSSNLQKEDDGTVAVYAGLSWEEVQNVRIPHLERTFSRCMTVGAHWAVEVLPKTPMVYPKTRMRLCNFIISGWLFCKDLRDEQNFARVLRTWPAEEYVRVADEVRKVLEYRFNDPVTLAKDNPTPRLGRLISSYEKKEEDVLIRTAAKAIGRLAPLEEIFTIGKLLGT